MKDLLLSEWRRFRRLTWIVAACHALALTFLSRITHLLQRSYEDHMAMLVIYMLLGLTLALVQVGSYRKPSQWLWLIHRPLPPQRIFAALALSALLMLSVAILLPLAGFVIATDVLSTQVVDTRHYVVPLYVLAFAMMAWLAAAHASVSRTRATVAVLVAPLLLALQLASVWALLVPVLLCLAWLAVIAKSGFRADRAAPISKPTVIVLTALPLQLAFFVLLFQLSKTGIDLTEMVSSSAPARTVLATDPNIDIEALQRTQSQQFLVKGLEGSDDARAGDWRAQLPLLDIAGFMPDLERFPVRHQVSNVGAPRWDETRGIEWTFSHDRMLYAGRIPSTGERRGEWGTNGVEAPHAFAQVPLGAMTRSALYAIDDDTQQQHELLRLADGESFVAAPARALDRLFVLTDQRVLAYAPDRQASSKYAPPLLDWALPLTQGDERPVAVDVVELLDGWLVSLFHYAGPEYNGFAKLVPHVQEIFYIDAGGTASKVGEREIRGHTITLGDAPFVPQAAWWLSPALYTFARWPGSVLDTGLARPQRLAAVPQVRMFYPLAAGLMLLSLGLGGWWLRGARAGTRRGLWLAMCGLLGLPAFLSLVCLVPRAPRSGG